MGLNFASPPVAVPVDIFMRTHGARIMDKDEETPQCTKRDGYDIYPVSYTHLTLPTNREV